MMQANSPTDASEKIQSLDDVYYFGGQIVNDVQAVYPYTAKNYEEISMKPGDRLQIAGNHWDGYSKAASRKSKKTGMFPSYLVEKYVHIVDFPDYSNFDKELKEANST
jgi:glycoprotein 6-alpha-L-fucosyltransferase